MPRITGPGATIPKSAPPPTTIKIGPVLHITISVMLLPMTKPKPKSRSANASPAPAARRAYQRTGRAHEWTRAKMREFLRALAATASVSQAAQQVGMSRQSAYDLRARLVGRPFDLAWEVALKHASKERSGERPERRIQQFPISSRKSHSFQRPSVSTVSTCLHIHHPFKPRTPCRHAYRKGEDQC